MSDWPLIIFLACGGFLILLIGLLNITDLDSFFAALAMIFDWVSGLPGLVMDWIDAMFMGEAEAPVPPPKIAPSGKEIILKEPD